MSIQMSAPPRSPATLAAPITATTSLSAESLRQQLRRLNLYGLATHAEEIIAEPWLARVLEVEDCERQRAVSNGARIMQLQADLDYAWPKELDRAGGRRQSTTRDLPAFFDPVITSEIGLHSTNSAGYEPPPSRKHLGAASRSSSRHAHHLRLA